MLIPTHTQNIEQNNLPSKGKMVKNQISQTSQALDAFQQNI